MLKKNNRDFVNEFVISYKAAVKAKLTREEFAKLLSVKPDSLIRRRLAVKKETGLDLPFLNSVPDSADIAIDKERMDKYTEFVLEQKANQSFHTTKSFTGKKVYVITSAQNATPVHEGFLASILNYCAHRDAMLLIVPYRYKNPTSVWTQNNEGDEWWHPSVEAYLCSDDIRLSKRFRIMGHIPIQPTATVPLSGFDSYTGMDSAVFGHPKVQLKTIATPATKMPKLLCTTGAVTVPNYTDSKTGHIGDFHHSLSAVVVEIDDDDTFHLRHVHGDQVTGAFYDLNHLYGPSTIEKNERVAALVTGDTHAEFIDDNVLACTYQNEDSIVGTLKPEIIIFHDLMDFYSQNHHHRGREVIAIGKHRYGRGNVEEGLQMAADFVDEVSRPHTLNVIVKSNHDEAFDKWLEESNPKFDPENAQFYYWMKYHQTKNIQMTETGFSSIDPFEFWCSNPDQERGLANKSKTKFLQRGETFVVNNIELSFHGDFGLNGARGSSKSFSKIGPKTVIGHGHNPEIYEGCYRVGVSARLDLEYQKGQCSNWLHTHCVIYPDGKRTLINIINGKWKL
jgi:hypothetical protein